MRGKLSNGSKVRRARTQSRVGPGAGTTDNLQLRAGVSWLSMGVEGALCCWFGPSNRVVC